MIPILSLNPHRLAIAFLETQVEFTLMKTTPVLCAVNQTTIADIYPLNGTAKNRKFNITDYVRTSHLNELERHIEIIQEVEASDEFLRCIVIDFKDSQCRYDNVEQIAAVERAFAAFFMQNNSLHGKAQIIHEVFERTRINYLINEGSLKGALLRKAFTAEQGRFFQETKELGSRYLCQLCEIIMNSFKQGSSVEVNGYILKPESFITIIRPYQVSGDPIKLLTLYPHCYEESYSVNSEYYQLITNAFRATHERNHDTTIITID